jgi:hypothetical protein
MPPEKLYIQTDRTFYAPGDTIWLKGYLFNAQFLTASTQSGLVYAELINDDNKIVKRMLFQSYEGLFRGAFPIPKDELLPGTFSLRAYSNWMRNWGDELVFTKKLSLLNIDNDDANDVSVAGKQDEKPANNGQAVRQHLEVKVDLQFLPEGGSMVTGLPSRVAFKAVAGNGSGIDLSGKLFDSRNQEVLHFRTTHAGMGYFDFTPRPGERYFAVIDNSTMSYPLPAAKTAGLVLQVANAFESEILQIKLIRSGNANLPGPYYLVGQSRGTICYGAVATFNQNEINSVVEKNKFPTGIARFTIFDKDLNPVCERITFIDRHDQLNIRLNTNQKIFHSRDSVALSIKVTNQSGQPVQGSFSIAVTDDGLSTADSSTNILTNLLLTGDLKGTVEDPAYYMACGAENYKALECLLLTQGWVGYHWDNRFRIPKIRYQPQSEFTIGGRITNVLNKGVSGSAVRLFSRHPFFTMDTVSNEAGEFKFRNIPLIDTGNFLLQAVKKNNKSRFVGFEMQDAEPLPVITKPLAFAVKIIPDSIRQTMIRSKAVVKRQTEEVLTGKNMLKEVIIKAKKIVKGSKNLNGPGNADQVLDERDMLKAGKTSLLTLLYNKIIGFHEGMFPVRITSASKFTYMIKAHCVKLIFDGIDADNFFSSSSDSKWERLLNMKGLLEQFSAEDIKGIEVMYKGVYNNAYNASFADMRSVSAVNDVDYAYIEITTRAGRGPFNGSGGFFLYKPLMPALIKEFYSPVYKNSEAGIKTDFRSTIHWQPDVITDEKGEAYVKFFTSDRTTTCTIIAEGSNMAGAIGFGSSKIAVK